MARLFIAVWPTEKVVEELCALRRKDQRGVRFVPPENWHITLRFLGECDERDAVEALHTIDLAGLPPVLARLGPAVDVLSDRSLVVPVAGVDELARRVADVTRELGEAPRKRFVGHLTIARRSKHGSMPTTLGALVDAAFRVDEVALVQSRLEPTGARYETIDTHSVGG